MPFWLYIYRSGDECESRLWSKCLQIPFRSDVSFPLSYIRCKYNSRKSNPAGFFLRLFLFSSLLAVITQNISICYHHRWYCQKCSTGSRTSIILRYSNKCWLCLSSSPLSEQVVVLCSIILLFSHFCVMVGFLFCYCTMLPLTQRSTHAGVFLRFFLLSKLLAVITLYISICYHLRWYCQKCSTGSRTSRIMPLWLYNHGCDQNVSKSLCGLTLAFLFQIFDAFGFRHDASECVEWNGCLGSSLWLW